MKAIVKRLSLITLAAVMTVSMFAGCTKKVNESSNAAATTSQTKTETQESVTLKYASWTNTKDPSGNYFAENVTKEFTKKNPNINVEFQLITENDATEYMKKTDIMLAAGEDIDIVQYARRDDYADRVRRGMLAPMDEYIQAEGKKFSDMFTVDTTVDGKIYALPKDVSYNFVMINKKYLDEAGLATPKLDWTWADYREYAKALTKGEGNEKRYGSYMHTWPDFKIYGTLNAYDYQPLLKKDGTSNITDPNIKSWLQYMNELESVDKSQLPYYDAKSTKLAYRDVFFQGKAAMIPIGTWMIAELSSTIEKYPHDWQVVFAPVPKFNDNAAGSTATALNYTAINKTSKYKAEAYKLAKFDCDEGVYMRAFGLPAIKGYDIDVILKTMMGGKENLYDVASLKAVIGNPNMKTAVQTNVFPYSKKVTDTVDAEFEKYMVGGEKLDEAISNADKLVNDIVAAGK